MVLLIVFDDVWRVGLLCARIEVCCLVSYMVYVSPVFKFIVMSM